MARAIRAAVIIGVVILFFAGVVGGFILILSGGDIVNFVQLTMSRISLASQQEALNTPLGTDDSPVRFTVESGDTPMVIANNLYAAQLIRDADLFVDYVRVERIDRELEAGTYFLNQTQAIPEIAIALTDSRSSQIPFRVLEGWRIEEIADAIDDSGLFAFTGNEFLAVVGPGAAVEPTFAALMGIPAGASLEGFLFPDTYQLPPNITPAELRDTLTRAFLNATGQQMQNDVIAQGLTMREAVTLASIVEREAVWEDEHPLIASVYRNRLGIDMQLQADPTVQYGLNGARGSWWPNITQADYQNVRSSYNTYLNTGLPPGPIANPGISAIRAAVYPAESSYFYFRARCDGTNRHNFATTYDEHVANGC